MNSRHIKLTGRRKAGTYGRTAKKRQKRIANKATRKNETGGIDAKN